MAFIKVIPSHATTKKIESYLKQEDKTEEHLQSGINCDSDNFSKQVKETNDFYNKNQDSEDVKYHHVIQSFDKKDNITPEKAHELGRELAERKFKGHEVLVVTHIDREHIHNHMVVNSVSYDTGKKYDSNPKTLIQLKKESNMQCKREGFTQINLDKKANDRMTDAEFRIIQKGQDSWKQELKDVIKLETKRCSNLNEFREKLKYEYNIETRVTKNSISYTHPDCKKAVRGKTLGEDYTKGSIEMSLKEKLEQEKMLESKRLAEEIKKASEGIEEQSNDYGTREKQRIEKDRQTEEKRIAEERQKEYDRNQKEIQKASERRREQEQQRKEIQLQQHEELRRKEQELLEKAMREKNRTEHGEKEGNPVVEYQTQNEQLRDLANSQKGFETLIKAQSHDDMKNQEKIEDYNYLKTKVDTLNKLDKSMADCKDKGLMKKYQATKEGLEEDIGRVHSIYREKPKMFQSKAKTAEQDKTFKEKIDGKLKQLEQRKEQAEKNLSKDKDGKQNIDYTTHEQEIRGKVQEHIKEQQQTEDRER